MASWLSSWRSSTNAASWRLASSSRAEDGYLGDDLVVAVEVVEEEVEEEVEEVERGGG